MEKINWETLNQFMLDYQQELIGLSVVAVLLFLVGWAYKARQGKDKEAAQTVEQVEALVTPDKSDFIDEADVAPILSPEPEPEPAEKTLTQRFRSGLARTGQQFSQLFSASAAIDEELLEELETYLLMADVGVDVTQQVMATLNAKIKSEKLESSSVLKDTLKRILLDIILPCEQPLQIVESNSPSVVLVVGVNGVGKTTTIGKLSRYYSLQGKKVLLAAGDTFRAAAVEQLQVWGDRNNVPVVAQHTGADSASVIFDAIESARAKNVDLVVADTAGRLHNKSNLMEELKKIKRVAGKLDPAAPHEVILVLDAGTGQNALSQMEEFSQAAGVTGIVLTKLDGTAKGGVVFPLCQKYGVPIRFVGLGEGVDDLQPFVAETFVDALFPDDDE